MAKELTNIDPKEVSYKTFDGETVTLNEAAVRNITNNNNLITAGEIALFIETAKFRRLNPFLGQLYLVKYDNSKPAQTVVAKSAMLIIAEEHPAYDGMEHGIIVKSKNGEISDRTGCIMYDGETVIGGWAKVYRSDRRIPFEERISITEYSKGQSTWKNMPLTMIDKCAQVKALRTAFPKQLGGLYIEEEFSEESIDYATPTMQPMKEQTTEPTYDIPTDDVLMTEKTPIRVTTINGKEYPVYPINPNYKILFATEEGFPSNADKYILVDKEAKSGRIAVQEINALN